MADRPDFDVYEAIEEDIAQAVELLRPQLPPLRKEYQQRFDAHIAQLHLDWRDPFDRYDECLVLATSLGIKYGEVYIPHVEIRGDWTYAALHRLHGRACLIGSEIRVLLQSGHGIAAEARSRTLYEVAVVSWFISLHGHDTAERYLRHQGIDEFRQAKAEVSDAARHGIERPNQQHFGQLEQCYAMLLKQYGQNYETEYGWAAHALKPGNPKYRPILEHLEDAIDFRSKYYYKRSSSHIHHSALGSVAHLRDLAGGPALVIEPVNYDLAFAANASMGLLVHCTMALFSHGMQLFPAFGSRVLALQQFYREMEQSFDATEQRLAAYREQADQLR